MEIDTEKEDEARRRCRCAELEETTRKAEMKILELVTEIDRMKNENEALEALIREQAEKTSVKGGIKVDMTEGDKLFCLMEENETLECEKKKAESDAEIWKGMVELLVSKLDNVAGQRNIEQWLDDFVEGSDDADYIRAFLSKLKCGAQVVRSVDAEANYNTPVTPYSSGTIGVCSESKKKSDGQSSKLLSSDDEKIPPRFMAPSTPAVDDEDEINDSEVSAPNDRLIRKNRVSSASGKEVNCGSTLEQSLSQQDHVEEADNFTRISTPKRKRAVNTVYSDSDSDNEDHVPLSKLKRMNIQESQLNSMRSADSQGVMTRSKQRLFTVRECEGNVSYWTSGNKNQRGISTMDDGEDSESEEDESGSGEQSLSSFIDDRSDPGGTDSDDNASTENENKVDSNVEVDSGDNDSDDNAATEFEDEKGMDVEFGEILSQLGRCKGNKLKWEYEADMLRAFGEDPEMCMKAVCALYRQQTEDEKAIKGSFVYNNRGFSKFDANRGCQIAEFLIDGDPLGNVKKSVEELQERYADGVKLCQTLSTRYSKQLFEIYTQEEDPLFNHVEMGHK